MWWLGSLTFHTFLAWPGRSKRPCRPAPPQCTECQGSQVISVETAIVTATACGVVGCATAGAAGAVIVNVRLAVAPPRRNAPRSARAESGRPAGGSQALPVHV